MTIERASMGMDDKKLTSWGGIPVEELTREQLIEALQYYTGLFQELYSPQAIRARALGQVEMIKRGEATSFAKGPGGEVR